MSFFSNLPNRGTLTNVQEGILLKQSVKQTYIPLHNTDPPESQQIKTEQINMVKRILQQKTKNVEVQNEKSTNKKDSVKNLIDSFTVELELDHVPTKEPSFKEKTKRILKNEDDNDVTKKKKLSDDVHTPIATEKITNSKLEIKRNPSKRKENPLKNSKENLTERISKVQKKK